MSVTLQGSGQVPVQVISTTKADTFTSSSTSYVDVTGLSVTITPTNTNNKILVFVDSNGSVDGGNNLMMQLVRNSTPIAIGNAAGSRSQAFAQARIPSDSNAAFTLSTNFVDSPSTTSATTYKIQIKVQGGTGAVNRTNSDTDTSVLARTASTITVMEISG